MLRIIDLRITAAIAAALGLALAAGPASAVPRHKAVVAKAGAPIRVGNHTHFKFSTCQALSIPKVVIRQKPTKGTLTVTEGVLPLRNTLSEDGEDCIGVPMRTAIVQYTPSANASGDDRVAYDVIYPSSCTQCRQYEVTASISIVKGATPPTSADTIIGDQD